MSSRMGRMLLARPQEAAWIQKALIAASEQEGEPDAPQASASADALAHALRSLLGGVFSGADGAAAPRRGLGEHTVNRLFAAAEEFLRANVARPIYNADICEALRVSPRTLHDAFVTACGMSPQAYLKLRRLMLVRCALRSGGPGGARLVKSVALAHGFWHLGNFAHDYRVYFGETPSETLAAARSARDGPSRNAEEEAGLSASSSTRSGQPRAGAGAAQCGCGTSPNIAR
ncbi:MAG: helix-turn-helix domain-containing protein [Acetobacteraceae bacterium]|nr:helix-turn-helix domain-containing protein [Acetobacteraceae bacterium]